MLVLGMFSHVLTKKSDISILENVLNFRSSITFLQSFAVKTLPNLILLVF